MINFKNTLANIARAIVDKPDEVSVLENEDENGYVALVLSVSPDDMGKVIGKHGKIAKAIRQIMKTAAAGSGKKVTVDIK